MRAQFRSVGSLAAPVIASALPASAGSLDIYEHNGSVIDWSVLGDTIEATYATMPGAG